jgi:hypothetical protein
MSLSASRCNDLNLGMTTVLQRNARHAKDSRWRLVDRTPSDRTQARKKVDLSGPYGVGLVTALSLPTVFQNGNHDEKIAKEFRLLYEAANGRQVMTALGPIGIAPAVAPWLKDAPLFFATREEFCGFVARITKAREDEFNRSDRD